MSRTERGAAAVESAVVVPLLVGLLAGIVELNSIHHLQSTVSGAGGEDVQT